MTIQHLKKILLFIFFVFPPLSLFSQSIDQSFGDRGWITENLDNIDNGRFVLTQPDNKILVGGNKASSPTYGDYIIVLLRYNADGTRDLSFGNDGLVEINNTGDDTILRSLDLQSDGKIVFTATQDISTNLYRYLPNGMPDPTFGTNGYKTLRAEEHNVQLISGKVLSNDDILILQRYYDQPDQYFHSELWKYDRNGIVDISFGNEGKIELNFGYLAHSFGNIALTPTGVIIVSGSVRTLNASNEEIDYAAIVNVNANGTLNNNFGNGAGYIIDDQMPHALPTIQNGNKIVIASAVGVNHSLFTGAIRLARYHLDGALDVNFGTNGYATYDPGSFADSPYCFLLQPDEKILLGGDRYVDGVEQGFLTRFNTDGSLDTSFSSTGTISLKNYTYSSGYHGTETAYDMTYHGHSNIVIVGENDFDLMVGKLIMADISPSLLIPDPNFEQALIDQGIDSDGVLNGQMPSADAEAVISLDISGQNISDLSGLEGFIKLESLDCSNNQITSLDTSLNTNLLGLDCSNNVIAILNIDQNTKLIDLDAHGNNIADVSLINLTSLETLLLAHNALVQLNIQNGANDLLSIFDTGSNPNLSCIEIDADKLADIPITWQKDPTAVYSADCNPDTLPPTVRTKDISITVNSPVNGARIWVNQVNDGSYDDTTFPENLQFSLDRELFYCSDVGEQTVTLTVMDEAGNSATGELTVTVVDNGLPSVTAKNIYRTLDKNGQLQLEGIDFLSYSSDNCGDLVYSLDRSLFTCVDIGRQFIVLTATDKSGNSDTDTAWVQISGSDACIPIQQSTQVVNELSCYGTNDAVVQISAQGGAVPYLYELLDNNYTTLDGPQVSNIFEGLGPGNYITRVIDDNGEESFAPMMIQEPQPLDMTGSIDEITCYAANDGKIEITATGGTAPYNYSINGGVYQLSNRFENLAPGQYTVEVSDSNGCTSVSLPFVLLEPTSLTMDLTKTDISCHGNPEGQLEITANGGTAPYLYRLNGGNFQSSYIFTNLTAGQYVVEVSDTNNCMATEVIEITEPEELSVMAITSDISCKGLNNGGITISAEGTAPFTYSLNGGAFQQDNEFIDLSPGAYTAMVRDANGCTMSIEVAMDEPDSPDFDNDGIGDACDDDIDGDGIPNHLDECPETPPGTLIDSTGCSEFTLPSTNFTIQTTGETCATSNNGSILITAMENLDYQATLRYGASADNKFFRAFTSFQDLEAGTYEVCIEVVGEPDFERCFFVQIAEPEPLQVDTHVNPSGKSITLKMGGGSNYTITLNDQKHTTSATEITLPLQQKENRIMVHTDKDCQGVYEDLIMVDISDMYVYPNPADSGTVSITAPGTVGENLQWSLYASDGKLVLQQSTTKTEFPIELNVSGLTSGVYSLSLEVGNKRYSRRIMIK